MKQREYLLHETLWTEFVNAHQIARMNGYKYWKPNFVVKFLSTSCLFQPRLV